MPFKRAFIVLFCVLFVARYLSGKMLLFYILIISYKEFKIRRLQRLLKMCVRQRLFLLHLFPPGKIFCFPADVYNALHVE